MSRSETVSTDTEDSSKRIREDYISNQSEAENSEIKFYKQKEEEYHRKKNSSSNRKRIID